MPLCAIQPEPVSKEKRKEKEGRVRRRERGREGGKIKDKRQLKNAIEQN
jgi:hypothetical protein